MHFEEFILAHDTDDLGQLALARDRYAFPEFDVALTTLECRRKLAGKVPEWVALPSLRFPVRLSAEQCSSSQTARYKALVAAMAVGLPSETCGHPRPHKREGPTAGGRGREATVSEGKPAAIADLTGGLGVDSWAFAQVFGEVLYNEMQPQLAAAVEQNFRELGLGNVTVKCSRLVSQAREADGSTVREILAGFSPDILFLDPARRAADGRKVFRLEDCDPNVLQLLPELLEACPRVLLKLSPMADISLVCRQLGCVSAVHVVAAGGECKELLLLLERGHEGPCALTVYENGSVMVVDQDQGMADPGADPGAGPGLAGMAATGPEGSLGAPAPGQLLFEPGKALLKAGAFDTPCRYGLKKLGRHTHLYVGAEVPEALRPFGKVYQILEVAPLNHRSIKEIGQKYPQAEVTARNIPITSNQLRTKLGVRSGGTLHIFGVRLDLRNTNALIVSKL